MAASDHLSPVNFETFDRYENGQMSHAEQHALEKRMLEDHFVAEAYEGYLAMKAAKVDNAKVSAGLSDALNARVGRKRKFITMWSYAAAAFIIVLLGASWLVFFNNQEYSPETSENTPAVGIDIGTDKTLPQKPAPPTSSSKKTLTAAPAASPRKTPSQPQQIEASESPEQVAGDEVNFKIDKQELIVAAEPAPAPVLSAPAASSAPATVLADKAEAVKPGLSKSGFEGAKLAAKSALASLDSAAAPAAGWEAYQTYLQRNTELKSGNADITVRFTVNADGTLSAFTATGNQPALYDRAIHIIKDGPAWRSASSRGTRRPSPQEVTLHFHSAH